MKRRKTEGIIGVASEADMTVSQKKRNCLKDFYCSLGDLNHVYWMDMLHCWHWLVLLWGLCLIWQQTNNTYRTIQVTFRSVVYCISPFFFYHLKSDIVIVCASSGLVLRLAFLTRRSAVKSYIAISVHQYILWKLDQGLRNWMWREPHLKQCKALSERIYWKMTDQIQLPVLWL